MMRSRHLLPIMFLAASCATDMSSSERIHVRRAHPAETGPSEDSYTAAKRHLARGNAGLAIDAFRKAIRENPGSADALNGLAVAYDRIERFDLSRQAYEEALALAPSDRAILRNLKTSLVTQGLLSEAARLTVELGEAPVVTAGTRPWIAPAPAGRTANGGMRLERISVREVALVTNRSSNGWDASMDRDRPVKTASATTLPHSRYSAVSSNGVLELVLPRPATAGLSVTVLNAARHRGLARTMSDFLRERGWSKTAIGDSQTRHLSSFLIHAPQDRLNAVLLAKTLPFESRLIASSKARSLILLLGRDATKVGRLRRASAS